MRRRFVLTVMLAVSLLSLSAAESPEMQVILLGTGYPRPDPERAGPANALVVGEKVLLVDAGRGVMTRFWQTGLPAKNIRGVFLTHLHSDHTSVLPDFFATTWIFGRHAPLELYGPEGTGEMARALEKYFSEDIRIRRDLTERLPAAGATLNVHLVREGVVYEDSDVRVTAFAVDHRPVEPAFGYKFEAKDAEGRVAKTIVISGDTRPSENLIKHANGADVLVHEVYLPEHFDRVDTPEVAARLKAYHTSAEEVGEVAAKAGVKLLVLTHVIPSDGEAAILERASRHFKGRIVVARDLMRF